jgi:hypothetical protein
MDSLNEFVPKDMLPEEYGGKAGPIAEINRKWGGWLYAVVLPQSNTSYCYYNTVCFFTCRPVVRENGHLQGLVPGTGKDQS